MKLFVESYKYTILEKYNKKNTPECFLLQFKVLFSIPKYSVIVYNTVT